MWCVIVSCQRAGGVWVGILLNCKQQLDLCLLLQIVGGEAVIWNPGQLHFHTWIHERQSLWTASNPWLRSFIVSAVSFSLDCIWIAQLPLPGCITSNEHLCSAGACMSLYWYMTLITQLAAFWFVEVVLTNYQDVCTVSLNLLNLLLLITCSVHLRLSLYVLTP